MGVSHIVVGVSHQGWGEIRICICVCVLNFAYFYL